MRRAAGLLARDVAGTPPRLLGQLCWTSNAVKSTGRHRLAFVPTDHHDAVERLRAAADGDETHAGRARSTLSLGWLVTGQGAQHPGMTGALYAACGAYRRALHEADEVLAPLLGASVLDTVRDRTATTVPAEVAQPALFAVGYALGRVLDDLGARPDWLLGHSLGEFAVAVHAGALTLADAAHLVALRSRLMARLPAGGGMLAARCPVETVAPLLADEPLVDLAAVNGPRDVVCAGDEAGLDRIAEALRAQRVALRRLDVPYAFHSPLMDPVLAEFARGAAPVEARPARRPVYSGLRGRLLGPDELMDADYWTAHLREPVRFADAAAAALAAGPSHLVEVGPRRVLSPLLRSMPAGRTVPTLTACPGPDATGAELWELTARLHRDGLDPDWTALYEPEQRVLRRLSPYPFSTAARFWLGAPAATPAHPVPEPAHLRPLPASRPAPPPGDHLDDEVLDLVAEVCGYPRHQVARDASLHEQLGYDSIMVVQLKERIEARWGIRIDVRELLSEVGTPGQLVEHLRTRVTVGKGHHD
ncbi:acyltransferase domain-containing protein [Micromonospora sp. R77]|uniref:acyltransferase domain-containing protein n=1 Tax=Micromonospora sp. R77 TaxID=2925836 RepID=UPI001F60C856|nr:acyltransferase domain-containing protein [Micromonospora sp. R77]MCI4065578.1 acyltransferase domain-containing protein [Micromonospora sp. R77]